MIRPATYRRQSGMSLIEVMLVLAIVGGMVGGAVLSYRAVGRAQFRRSVTVLAGTIRGLYTRSISMGKACRIAFDIDGNTYKAEKTNDRFLLERVKDNSSADAEEREKEKAEEEKRAEEDEKSRQVGKLESTFLPPPKPKRATWSALKADGGGEALPSNVHIRDVYTPRQEEPFTEGKAYLHFFPDGRTERAIIHMRHGEGDDAEYYTLIVHPLSGRVEVKKGDIEVPSDFDYTDDEGNREGSQ